MIKSMNINNDKVIIIKQLYLTPISFQGYTLLEMAAEGTGMATIGSQVDSTRLLFFAFSSYSVCFNRGLGRVDDVINPSGHRLGKMN